MSNSGIILSIGDTSPRLIPDIPPDIQFTVTLINNEQWLRTARVCIDAKKDEIFQVRGHSVTSKAFNSVRGQVTFALFDSKCGPMCTPLEIFSVPLGYSGKAVSFGAEKLQGEKKAKYMDVYIHFSWSTDIKK